MSNEQKEIKVNVAKELDKFNAELGIVLTKLKNVSFQPVRMHDISKVIELMHFEHNLIILIYNLIVTNFESFSAHVVDLENEVKLLKEKNTKVEEQKIDDHK